MGEHRLHRHRAPAATVGALLILTAAGLPAQAGDSGNGSIQASAIFAWHLAPSLATLRDEINSRWPGRDRSSDGAVGDPRHRRTTNSHNPARYPGGPSVGTRGAVHALDVTASGIDVDAVLRAVIGDPRVWYVIHDRRIWSRTYGWAARPYGGDPHTTHLHINLREDSQSAAVAAETNTSRWLGSGGGRGTIAPVSSVSTPAPRLSASATKALQRALISAGYRIPSGPTGWYGPETTAAVARFQRAQGWRGSGADGIAGRETLRRLGVDPAGGAPASSPASTTPPPAPTRTARAGTVAPGTASAEVQRLQKALIARGYRIPAGATGYYGSQTVAAVKKFQRAQGWSGRDADGAAGPTTLKRLGLGSATGTPVAKAPPSSRSTRTSSSTRTSGTVSLRNLRPGVAHRDVHALQKALIARGYRIPAGATGYYGPRTRAAVRKFQRAQGWSGKASDGIPGSSTVRLLGL